MGTAKTERIATQDVSTPNVDPVEIMPSPEPNGRMWFDQRYRNRLQQAGLIDVDSVMNSSRGRCLRALADRENWYLWLDQDHTSGAFLKRHHVRTWWSLAQALMGRAPGMSAGRTEACNVARLASDGIVSARVIAWGERLLENGRLDSFFLTEELEGYLPLDDFLRNHFPETDPSSVKTHAAAELDLLISKVADVARQFHRAGYNHRDFYCCHFFVRRTLPGHFDVRLIDLQRVQHRRRFRGRWLVKDLAQLAYSAPRSRIGCKQRIAFLRRYLGVKRLRPEDKQLIRRVAAKQRRMQRRLGSVE